MNTNTTLIILAGGRSSRMRQPKGLLKYHQEFWILAQIDRFIGNEIFIGLGYDKEHYFEAIPWFKQAINQPVTYKEKFIRVVVNTTPKFGLFSNLQSVLKNIVTRQQVLVLPIDVPLLNAKEQQKLIEKKPQIVIPKYNDTNGHPIKLAPEFWESLLTVNLSNKDARLDYQIKKKPSIISFVETTDESCIHNLNTPKDWQAFICD